MIFLNSQHYDNIEDLLATHTEIAFVNTLPHKSQLRLLRNIQSKSDYTRLLFSNLWSNTQIITDLCAWLSTLPVLTHLSFSKTAYFSLDNFKQLGAAIQNIATLHYVEFSDVNVETLKITSLADCIGKSHLKGLKFNNCRISAEGVRSLLACTNLQNLHLTNTKLRNWETCFLNTNTTLQRLDLSGNEFLPKCGAAFWKWLKKSKITHLYMNRVPLLDPIFAAGFFSAILAHPYLQFLQLRECNLQHIPRNYIRQLLKYNTALTTLDLEKNKISYEIWLQVIASLQSNYTLKCLILDAIDTIKVYLNTATQLQILPRGNFAENECMPGYMIRLLCANDKLNLANSFWSVQNNKYHPTSTHARIIYLFHFMTKKGIPVELIYHILGFWYGVQTPCVDQ